MGWSGRDTLPHAFVRFAPVRYAPVCATPPVRPTPLTRKGASVAPFSTSQAIRILFVCHGNICRSTMAQSVMQHLVDQAGLSACFVIDSAATSTEEIGEPPHHGTRRVLSDHGVPCVPHRARQLRRGEYEQWDLFVGMDAANIRNMRRMLAGDAAGKVHKLMEYAEASSADEAADVADPWYTGDFETTYADVLAGCEALLAWCRSYLVKVGRPAAAVRPGASARPAAAPTPKAGR